MKHHSIPAHSFSVYNPKHLGSSLGRAEQKKTKKVPAAQAQDRPEGSREGCSLLCEYFNSPAEQGGTGTHTCFRGRQRSDWQKTVTESRDSGQFLEMKRLQVTGQESTSSFFLSFLCGIIPSHNLYLPAKLLQLYHTSSQDTKELDQCLQFRNISIFQN